MLLGRRRTPVLTAVESLVALQAQVPRDPYVALWSRLDRFLPKELSSALGDRRAVRMTLLRGTLHLVTAIDALALRPLVQPVVERTVFGQGPLRKAIESAGVDEVLFFFRALLEERPRTRAELVRAAGERWPARDANSLGYAMYLLPTVQVTPRGLWGRTGPSAFTTVERWLGREPASGQGLDELVVRYLTAFGPATAADVQTWSGLTGLRGVLERLRPGLRTLRDERGRELFDVPGGRLPDPETVAPVRFLPQYDNVLLGHADRDRIIPPATSQWTEVGWGTVLIDGFVQARWKLEGGDGAAALRIQPFRKLRRPEREEITEEGGRLATFLAPEAKGREVRIEPSGKMAGGS